MAKHDRGVSEVDQSLQASVSGGRLDFLGVPTKRVRGDKGRARLLRAFLTDAAWRGSAASLRISATICASSACVRGCVGMFP